MITHYTENALEVGKSEDEQQQQQKWEEFVRFFLANPIGRWELHNKSVLSFYCLMLIVSDHVIMLMRLDGNQNKSLFFCFKESRFELIVGYLAMDTTNQVYVRMECFSEIQLAQCIDYFLHHLII